MADIFMETSKDTVHIGDTLPGVNFLKFERISDYLVFEKGTKIPCLLNVVCLPHQKAASYYFWPSSLELIPERYLAPPALPELFFDFITGKITIRNHVDLRDVCKLNTLLGMGFSRTPLGQLLSWRYIPEQRGQPYICLIGTKFDTDPIPDDCSSVLEDLKRRFDNKL